MKRKEAFLCLHLRVRPSQRLATLADCAAEKIQAKFDLAIALALSTWDALSLAVQNSWGGPESLEKRDFLAGAVSELIAASPDADVDYIEEFLLQYMNDEFDVNIEDGSGEEVAAKIVGLRKQTLQGDFVKVDDMYQTWLNRKSKSGTLNFRHITKEEDEDDTDWDSDDIDGEEEDVDMHEAPSLVHVPKEKVVPKVDEDGFTEVVTRRRR